MNYVLHKNAVQLDTLSVIRYLHSRHAPQLSVTPTACVERNWPDWVVQLPSIECSTDGRRYVGMGECVRFWSALADEDESTLLANATLFAQRNPGYTTHGGPPPSGVVRPPLSRGVHHSWW